MHTTPVAAESARALSASAYTVGRHVVLGAGQGTPSTESGRRLLAHELTHVVQQDGAAAEPPSAINSEVIIDPDNDPDEMEARAIAASAATSIPGSIGRPKPVHRHPPGSVPVLQRQATSETREARPSSPESVAERLRRQAVTTARVLSDAVSDADRDGFAGITLWIKHTGDELVPGFEKVEPRGHARAVPVSSASIEREQLAPMLQMILISGQGRWQIRFARSRAGRIEFQLMERIEPSREALGPDDLEALGIPSRREIYAEIFRQAGQELREAGVMIAGFTLEQVVLWIVGGALLRVLGVLGTALGRAFPFVRNAIGLHRAAEVAEAVGSLGRADAEEFSILMQRSQRGTLSSAERNRLGQLMERVETWLGRNAPQLRRIAGTRGLDHSFDEHAAQWFGRAVPRTTHFSQWQAIVERAAQSRQVFDWPWGGEQTIAHLATIEDKNLVVQFFKTGPRAGELATAFVPDQYQLSRILSLLGHAR